MMMLMNIARKMPMARPWLRSNMSPALPSSG
jgi:hypothetical protein